MFFFHFFGVTICSITYQLIWGRGWAPGCMMRHTDFVEMTAPLCHASMGVDGGAMCWDVLHVLPSGKHTKNYGKSSCYEWENPLFQWPFSIAMSNYQRVSLTTF